MKKLILSLIMFAILGLSVKAQTYVSGGIYSNTTWTKVNSPYIVTDTVVVFPGVTLTIQPGVVVTFDTNVFIEIRQATLIASGTASDSITFTANSTTPSKGFWNEIFINSSTTNFNYCNFRYANYGICGNNSIYVKNSNFNNNNSGIYPQAYSLFIDLDSCIFKNNYGIYGAISCSTASINNCIFDNNSGGALICYTSASISNCSFDNSAAAIQQDANFKNCNFIYNTNCGIFAGGSSSGTINISHSYFLNNYYGINNDLSMGEIIINIDTCIISNNFIGVNDDATYGFPSGYTVTDCTLDSNHCGLNIGNGNITNCEIKYNAVGLTGNGVYQVTKNVFENDTIGIKLNTSGSYIECNKICNNISYSLYNNTSSNINVLNNYWCTNDSATIETFIYDGYDNISLGLVLFMPIDTLLCYLSGNCSSSFYLYPNTSIPHYYYAVNTATGVPPLKYLWSWGDGTTDTIAYPSHTYAAAGYYNICLKITDSTGCTHTFCDSTYLSKMLSSMVYVNVISPVETGINEIELSNQIKVYPNPTTDNITIDVSATLNIPAIIEITNIQGQLIETIATTGNKTNVDVSALAKGMYFVKVNTEKGFAVNRFVKE